MFKKGCEVKTKEIIGEKDARQLRQIFISKTFPWLAKSSFSTFTSRAALQSLKECFISISTSFEGSNEHSETLVNIKAVLCELEEKRDAHPLCIIISDLLSIDLPSAVFPLKGQYHQHQLCLKDPTKLLKVNTKGGDSVAYTVNRCLCYFTNRPFSKNEWPKECSLFPSLFHFIRLKYLLENLLAASKNIANIICKYGSSIDVAFRGALLHNLFWRLFVVPPVMLGDELKTIYPSIPDPTVVLYIDAEVSKFVFNGADLMQRGVRAIGVGAADTMNRGDTWVSIKNNLSTDLSKLSYREVTVVLVVPYNSVPFAVGVCSTALLHSLCKFNTAIFAGDNVCYGSMNTLPFNSVVPTESQSGSAMAPLHYCFDALWEAFWPDFTSSAKVSDGVIISSRLCPQSFGASAVEGVPDPCPLPLRRSEDTVDGDEEVDDVSGDDVTSEEEEGSNFEREHEDAEEDQLVIPNTPDEIALFAFCEALGSIPFSAFPIPVPTFIGLHIPRHAPRVPMSVRSLQITKCTNKDEEISEPEGKSMTNKEKQIALMKAKRGGKKQEKTKDKLEATNAAVDEESVPSSSKCALSVNFKATSYGKPLSFLKKTFCNFGDILTITNNDKDISVNGKNASSLHSAIPMREHRLKYQCFLQNFHRPLLEKELAEAIQSDTMNSLMAEEESAKITRIDVIYGIHKFVSKALRDILVVPSMTQEADGTSHVVEICSTGLQGYKLGDLMGNIQKYIKKENLIKVTNEQDSEINNNIVKGSNVNINDMKQFPELSSSPSVAPTPEEEYESGIDGDVGELVQSGPTTVKSGATKPVVYVTINDLLRSSMSMRETVHTMKIEQFRSTFISKLLVPMHRITVQLPHMTKRLTKKGPLPTIYIRESLRGNKRVALISGVSDYGLSVNSLATVWKKQLGCAVTVETPEEGRSEKLNKLPPLQLVLPWKLVKRVTAELIENGVPSSSIKSKAKKVQTD
eukprot:Tbor_TRINITY_DN4139_c0_g1::TRINITY_DN4139_c0_g1_i1::g.26420::m.26420